MPALNTRHRQPIAALWYSSISGILTATIALFLISILSTSLVVETVDTSGVMPLVIAAGLVLALVAILFPALYYFFFSYEISEHAITINSGIIFRQHETINFSRIQVIDNERGPLLMLFGLTLIEIWTASPDQVTLGTDKKYPRPDATILLGKDAANAVKDYILQRPAVAAL